MSAVRKLQITTPEEQLFDLYDEYKELTGGNCIIQAAVDVTRHRYESKRKHITYHEAKGVAEYSLYGTTADGKTSPHETMVRMVNVAWRAKNKAASMEAARHLERKWQLMKGIVDCLESIYQD